MKMIRNLKDRIIKKLSIKLYNKIILKRAISKAKLQWIRTGKRQYVIPADNNFIIVDRSVIKRINKSNKRKWTVTDLINSAVYITPVSTFHNI
jgi:hypothetical protein